MSESKPARQYIPLGDLENVLAELREKEAAQLVAGENELRTLQANMHSVRERIIGVRIVDGGYTVITDPAHGIVLADHHEKLNIKKRVVEIALSKNQQRLVALWQEVLKNGGFFEDFTPEFEANRIGHAVVDPDEGGWKIVESHGILTRKDFSLGPDVAGGDIQLKLPSVRSTGFAEALRLNPKKKRGPKDRIDPHHREIWEEIAAEPAAVAWISDVCSLRGSNAFGPEFFPPAGFASKAKDGVFEEVRQINTERKIPIRWALSAVAEVVRLWNRAKSKVLHEFHPTLFNQRGLDIVTERERVDKNGVIYRNAYLGKQLKRMMPVELPGGDTGYLEFTWHIGGEEISRPVDEQKSPFDQ